MSLLRRFAIILAVVILSFHLNRVQAGDAAKGSEPKIKATFAFQDTEKIQEEIQNALSNEDLMKEYLQEQRIEYLDALRNLSLGKFPLANQQLLQLKIQLEMFDDPQICQLLMRVNFHIENLLAYN